MEFMNNANTFFESVASVIEQAQAYARRTADLTIVRPTLRFGE
jgi:hypothetical protein